MTFNPAAVSLIVFHGSDWKEWLQGQITNDIRTLSETHPINFCLCKPTGQILALGELHEDGRMFVPASCIPSVLARVDQMVILEECEASENPMPADWQPFPGSILPRTSSTRDEILANQMPVWGEDISESNFPAEMGSEFESKVISYTKGCYTGQEVNHRLHTRGHTNKTWGVFRSPVATEQGADLLNSEGIKIGSITSSANHKSHGWLVGGFVRNGETPALEPFKP